MVILMVRIGQLCNRLFSVGAFVANSIENGHSMLCTSFDDYYDNFETLNANSRKYKIRFLQSDQRVQKFFIKIVYKIIRQFPITAEYAGIYIYKGKESINNNEFITLAKNKNLFVHGWPYWDVKNFIKHADALRKIFTPKQKYFDIVKNFLEENASEFDLLIGVHVRMGDYKNYLNGRFYFSPEIYLLKIEELGKQLKALNKKPLFILCSNEDFITDKKISESYITSRLDGVSDLILLSKCDYIFGPPSTYSMWASFYGQVPYNNFFASDEILKIEDFSPIIAPSTFANGRELIDVFERYSA